MQCNLLLGLYLFLVLLLAGDDEPPGLAGDVEFFPGVAGNLRPDDQVLLGLIELQEDRTRRFRLGLPEELEVTAEEERSLLEQLKRAAGDEVKELLDSLGEDFELLMGNG